MAEFTAPAWAQRQRFHDRGSMTTLLVLANHADAEGICFPGQDLLAEITQQSRRQVQRQLNYLESLGLISREYRQDALGHRSSSRYTLHLDRVVEVGKDDPRRGYLRGLSVSGDVLSVTGDDPNVTVGTAYAPPSGAVTPSNNSQRENSQLNSQSPEGDRPSDLHRYFVKRLVESVDRYDSGFDGSLQPKAPVCGQFKRMLKAGLRPQEIRWMIDRYMKTPADWYGDTRWMDFFNHRTQERLRGLAGNSPRLRSVTEAVAEGA